MSGGYRHALGQQLAGDLRLVGWLLTLVSAPTNDCFGLRFFLILTNFPVPPHIFAIFYAAFAKIGRPPALTR